jgi:hypothetical protein
LVPSKRAIQNEHISGTSCQLHLENLTETHPTPRTCMVAEVELQAFLTSQADEGRWSVASRYRLKSGGKRPWFPFPRTCSGPRRRSERCAGNCLSRAESETNTGHPRRSTVTKPTELFRILCPYPEPNKTQSTSYTQCL